MSHMAHEITGNSACLLNSLLGLTPKKHQIAESPAFHE